MKKTLSLAIASVFLFSTLASMPASADESTVRKSLEQKYKEIPKNTPVSKTPIAGLYEVNIMGKPAYTNETVDFLLVGGALIDANTLEDLTEKRQPRLLRDMFKALPLDKAIKTVYGKGERIMVTFEDPDCPYCKEMTKTMWNNSAAVNATVYTFLLPLKRLHPDADRKSRTIMCSKNPARAWKEWMTVEKAIPSQDVSCEAAKAVDVGADLGKNMGFNSTPRLLFASGSQVTGAIDVERLEKAFQIVAKQLADLGEKPSAEKPVKK